MPRKKQEEIKTKAKKKEKAVPAKVSYYQALGRRKTSVARVKIIVGGSGKIIVNQKPVEEYFPGEIAKKFYLEPLVVTNNLGRFDIVVKVKGSGKSAQLGALVHGLARALQEVDRESCRPILKKQGFLTRDARAKERRKPGLAGKARKRKQSPKR